MADLTLTITESITLNSVDQGGTTSKTFSSIGHTSKRIVTCPASNTTTLLTFNTNVYGAAGAIDLEDTKYIRITNLDSANTLELAMVGTATLYQISLRAGQSHLISDPDNFMLAEADTSPSFGSMADIVTIQANPGGDNIKLEVFTAGT